MMFQDFILNGQANGPVADTLAGVRFDPGLLRPYLLPVDGRNLPAFTINTGRIKTDEKGRLVSVYQQVLAEDLSKRGINSPVTNATSLRKEDWIHLDQGVILAARQSLRAWAYLAAANTFSFPGMSKLTLEYEAQADVGEAVVDYDGLTQGRNDAPLYKLRSLPLPITHSDFEFSERRLAVSRNTATPLDTTMAEAAGRRVAEMVEKTTIGVETGSSYGYQSTGVTAHDSSIGSTVYGYTNYPHRATKTNMVTPTSSNPNSTVDDVLAMRSSLYSNKFYGPFMVYHSTDWDQFLDNDYAFVNGTDYGVNPSVTLRERLRKIEGIQDVRRLDFLHSIYTMLLF